MYEKSGTSFWGNPKWKNDFVINQFKSSVKRRCNQNGFEYFEWQRNYYEHVIRNENHLARIREYIFNNPLKWELGRSRK